MPFRGEIWDVNLLELRKSTEEMQLIDPTKPYRPHLVLQTFPLRKGVSAFTVVPLQTPEPRVSYRVQAYASKSNGLLNDSWVVCCQLLTIENKFLSRKLGMLEKNLFDDVLVATKSYLRLI